MRHRSLFGLLCLAIFAAIGAYHLIQIPADAATADSILANKKPSPLSEPNFDRPGMDFKNFDAASDDPWLCESACNNEQQCKAWTYVKPGVQGPKPRCWLKTGIPNPCCTSGIKAGFCDSGSYWDASANECRPRVN